VPPFWETVLAIAIGLGIAAALIGLFALTAWLAGRHADRYFPKFLADIERQGGQPWNTI